MLELAPWRAPDFYFDSGRKIIVFPWNKHKPITLKHNVSVKNHWSVHGRSHIPISFFRSSKFYVFSLFTAYFQWFFFEGLTPTLYMTIRVKRNVNESSAKMNRLSEQWRQEFITPPTSPVLYVKTITSLAMFNVLWGNTLCIFLAYSPLYLLWFDERILCTAL